MRTWTPCLCLFLAVVPACGGSHNPVSNPATATYVPWTGSIAFRSARDGNAELYRANPDSANPMRLTSNAVADEDPAWSHDGSKIAFVSTRDGNREIYVMDADGTGVMRLTNNPAADTHPAWSSDGSKIAFVSDRDGNDEIYVMDADGGNPTNLTNNTNEDEWPSWAPAGDKIAFHSYRDSSWDIYLMNPDGTGQVALTYSRMWEAPPARAPGGIVFTAKCPAWSPDGSRILFVTDEGGLSEISIMQGNGGQRHDVTRDGVYDYAPAWSPDGSRIAFVGTKDGNPEIYVIGVVDGSHEVRVTNNPSADDAPSWGSPIPLKPRP